MTADRPLDHEEMRDLVAAYALDAVEAGEVGLVEDHLRDCPRCRSELAAHQETAALLAHEGEAAPPGVWDRIAAGLGTGGGEEAPALRLVLNRAGRPAADRPGRRARRGAGPWAYRAAGAVAAAVIALMGAGLIHQDHRISRMDAALARQTLLRQATAAALDPSARRVALLSTSGRTEATVAVLPDGTAYVVSAALPDLPGSRTYQLWSIVGGRPVSDGLLGSSPGVSRVRAAGGGDVMAITDEPAGGSPRPTSAPIASGTV